MGFPKEKSHGFTQEIGHPMILSHGDSHGNIMVYIHHRKIMGFFLWKSHDNHSHEIYIRKVDGSPRGVTRGDFHGNIVGVFTM